MNVSNHCMPISFHCIRKEREHPQEGMAVHFVSEKSDGLMEGTRNDLSLLLMTQLIEVHCIAGNADGQVRVLLRMLVSRQQRFTVEYVYIQVMCILREVAAHDGNQIVHLLLTGLAKGSRCDGECVGDTIAAVGVT